jgi:hypothetical protein
MSRSRAVTGGEVNGIPVELRITVPMRENFKLTLGLTADRRIVGRWSPRMPRTFAPDDLWPRVNAALSSLLLAAIARPRLLIDAWQLPLPPAPIPRRPIREPRAIQ